MEPLPFNTFTLPLSSPRTTTTVGLSAVLQGITNVVFDYTNTGAPYKLVLQWDSLSPSKVILNELLPTSQTFIPTGVTGKTVNSTFKAYYIDGSITTFNAMFIVTSTNSIDLDLSVTDIQHTNVQGQVIFNIESNTNNIAFGVIS